MATLLSVRAESALLCLLQSHPFQPARGHMGQGLQHHLQPLQCLLVAIHSHHSSQHRGFHLLHKTRQKSQLFTCPLTYMFLSAGLWVSFAPCLGENCLVQLSFTWGLHNFQKLNPASHTNRGNYCCSIMFLHCHR